MMMMAEDSHDIDVNNMIMAMRLGCLISPEKLSIA